MTTHKRNAVGLHPERERRAAFNAYAQFMGRAATEGRWRAIEALPRAEWRGRHLRSLRCHGVSGKGPHIVNVPESLLWALISLDRYLCPFHAGDCWVLDVPRGAVGRCRAEQET